MKRIHKLGALFTASAALLFSQPTPQQAKNFDANTLEGLAAKHVNTQEVREIPKNKKTEQEYIEMIEAVNSRLTMHNDPNKIDIEVYVDSLFIEREGWLSKDWEQVIFDAVEFSNKHFKKFGKEFEIDAVRYVKFDESKDAVYLLHQHVYDHPTKLDIAVAFTGRFTPGVAGITNTHNHIVMTTLFSEKTTLMHELSHLFKAKDYAQDHPMFNQDSIMSYNPKHDKPMWDYANAGRMKMNLDRKWGIRNSYYENMRKFIEKFPKEKQANITDAFLYSISKPSRSGLVLTQLVSEQNPKDAQLLMFHLSQLFKHYNIDKKINEFEKTDMLAEYAQVLQLEVNSEIRNSIAWNLIEHMDMANLGIAIVQPAVRDAPKSAHIIDTLGWGYFKKEKYDKAEKYLRDALELSPKDKEIQEHLIDVMQAQKDLSGFIKEYQKLIKIDPYEGHTYYKFATRLLNEFDSELKTKHKKYIVKLAKRANKLYPEWEDGEQLLERANRFLKGQKLM